MIFTETKLKGVFLVEPERMEDERGFFARTWCQRELEARGLNAHLAQCSISFNARKGTLRGMHYQAAPYGETKLVRCTMGAVYDVVLDLRAGSETFGQWVAMELTPHNRRQVYIPEGLGHGFQTLSDDTEVFYQMAEFHHPEFARGVRWDDPTFVISWPLASPILSVRDRTYPDFCGEA